MGFHSAWCLFETVCFFVRKKKELLSHLTMPPQETTDVDVLIVGAGLSGIAAGVELERWNTAASQGNRRIRFHILEASARVGGRTLADEDGTDFGAAYVGPTQDRVLRLIDACGLKLRAVDMHTQKTVQYFNGTSSSYDGLIPPLSPLAVLDLGNAMARLDAMQREVDPVNPHASPDAMALDSLTFEEFLRASCTMEDARKALRVAVRVVLAVEPAEVSLLSFLWYIRQSGGVRRILETEGGAQDSKVIGGAGLIAVRAAADLLPAGSITCNSPVRHVDYAAAEHDVVTVQTAAGDVYRCRRLILAIPPVQQLKLVFNPPLAPTRVMSLQRYPMGHAIKTFMYYATPFWREKGLNGTAVCDDGIACVCFDDSQTTVVAGESAAASSWCIMGFVVSSMAAAFAEMSATERQNALAKHYAKVFESTEALTPIRYKEKVWAAEPWVGGCYVGVAGPLVLTKYRMAHREPIDNRVFIAGTEAAYVMTGYMDGAVEAGERAARNALVSIGRLDSSLYWDVTSKPGPSPQLPHNVMELSEWERRVPSVKSVALSSATIVCVAASVVAAWWIRNSRK